MKKILNQLFDHKTLSRIQAKEVMIQIAENKFTEAEIAAFVTVYLMRTISIEELLGFKDALLEKAVPVAFATKDLIDIVGTGGDGKNTFNISTLSCFIAAGAGHKVAKHGNYGSTSISGSSNVMEHLGYRFKNNSDDLNKDLERANICFLHAPIFHPALKAVAGVRKQLGIRTFFNMLGPMVNPVQPAYQVIGVYNMEMARLYNYMLQQGDSAYTIVHSLDGYDEISLTSDTKIITNKGEKVWSAEALGKRHVQPEDIDGGHTVQSAADIFLNILQRKGTWAQMAVVLANAAVALHITGKYENYEAAYNAALESLESGAAYDCFQKLIEA
jgi:anthranilate phosphoribosyltransferase